MKHLKPLSFVDAQNSDENTEILVKREDLPFLFPALGWATGGILLFATPTIKDQSNFVSIPLPGRFSRDLDPDDISRLVKDFKLLGKQLFSPNAKM